MSNSPKREFIINEQITEASVKDIIMGIIEANKYDDENEKGRTDYNREPIKIIINTFGGSLYDSLGVVGVINNSKTPVHTYCYAKAMSGGFLIFTSGHKRFATPLATFMYHDASYGHRDTVEGMECELEHIKKLRDLYDDYIINNTNLPKKKMDEHKKHKRDWFMFGEEALKYGIVDKLLKNTRQK